ncbi:MAG: Mu-like prophage major head subunit gpT family protein [Marinobacter sp.]|uniref:Mu-like prophage major head subunit gpT family protein n=1 Tax=Marinobacter sp. TaxID=50741 RepID=UPI00299D2317|nr:Mu-like prophage major head subunit gpT family protein [Marinobacter sp.]MDX1755881.1 Mu-like prophage major head subunit gpT family protein [Marinobacter sp.]
MIINQSNLKTLFTAYKAAFNRGFRDVDAYWSKVATLVPSSTGTEEYGWLGQFPKLREWIGDRHIKNMAAHGYSIRNKPFESTVGVPRDNIEDDAYGVFTPLMEEMGYAAKTHPDELIFALLAAGFTTPCYDGQYFFDTDHPVGDGTVSNMQAGAESPWFLLDVRRPLKPLIFQRRRDYNFESMTDGKDEQVFMRNEYRYGVDARVNVGFGFWQQAFGSKATLDAANYKAARQAVLGFRGDEGRPLGTNPNLLVCGPSNEGAAKELLQAERNASGATNIYRNTAELLVVPWLD